MPISHDINNLILELNTHALTGGFGKTKRLVRSIKRSFDPNQTRAARAIRIQSKINEKITKHNTSYFVDRLVANQDPNIEHRKLQDLHNQGKLSNSDMIKQSIDKNQNIQQARSRLKKQEAKVENPNIPNTEITTFQKRQNELSDKIIKKHNLGGPIEANPNK